MRKQIISGTIKIPDKERETNLHRRIAEFARWMEKPKDAQEIFRDRRKSVPIAMLPMVY
ncbi:hypothetical protein [Chryseobacterium oranimense]|uniref:hypothetical protein n=1 Tax=Chryseobacterium oranimense TaxID=421058 RepID=UPI000ADEECCA|nr:hypothetical protein [Chryseobacterium oranimense]